MYSAVDGTARRLPPRPPRARVRSAAPGCVMTEMICVSAAGRITPGCAGMYADEHVAAWRRIVTFAHSYGGCAIGAQLGHSGRKGSTKLMWEGIDEPLDEGNWPVIGPSPIPYSPRNQVPMPMTRADMDSVRESSCAAARRGRRPGSTCSSCTAPTGICCPRSCRRWRTRARTSTAGRWRRGRGSRSRCSTPAAPSGPRRSR